jgi:exoribonuclease II
VEGLLHLWEETRLHVVSGQNLLSVGSGSQMQEVEFPPVLRDLLKQTYFRQTQGETVGQILREVPWSVAILVKHRLEEDTSFNSDVSLQVTCITNPDA